MFPVVEFRPLPLRSFLSRSLHSSDLRFPALSDLSQPLVLLILAALLQFTDLLPRNLRGAIVAVYRFSIAAFTYPVLIIVD